MFLIRWIFIIIKLIIEIAFLPIMLAGILLLLPILIILKLINLDKPFLNWLNFHDTKSFQSAWELIDDANSIQISGKRRRGKSKFAVFLAIAAHHHKKLFNIMNDYVKSRNQKGFDLPYPDTPVCANLGIDLQLPGEKPVRNYGLEIEDFGVPNGQRQVPRLYRGMVIVQDENGSVYDGKDGAMPPYLEEGLRKQGHHKLTVIGTNHNVVSLSIRLKNLVEVWFHIPKVTYSWCYWWLKRDSNGKLKFIKIPFLTVFKTWYYSDFNLAVANKRPLLPYISPKLNIFKRLFTLGGNEIVEGARFRKFRFWGDIMSHYDCEEKEYAFERKLTSLTIIKDKYPKIDRSTPEGIELLNKKFCVIRAENSRKQKPKKS